MQFIYLSFGGEGKEEKEEKKLYKKKTKRPCKNLQRENNNYIIL